MRSDRGSGRRRGGSPTHARLVAVRVLERVERARAFADLALHAALARSDLSPVDRALATELVYGTLRWRGRLDHALAQVLDRDLGRLEPLVATTLRLGAYQLLFTDRVPDTAAVDESVRCVRAAGVERATGLVNAALRRLAREKDRIAPPQLEDDAVGHLTHALSLPGWIAERWLEQFGAEAAALLAEASNQAPPRTVRANRDRAGRAALETRLKERYPDVRPCRLAPDGLVLGEGPPPSHDAAFRAGDFTVQDEASQLVVALLDPQPGDRVLDTCAAPGTKTTGIAERLGGSGDVTALDRHAGHLSLIHRDARRLGLKGIRTLERDASRSLASLTVDGLFDRVLVDAPCSGLGTLRRNPDARWRLRPEDPAKLATVQRHILTHAADVLRPGGTLVYSTCTVLPEENEQLVTDFVASRDDLRLVQPEESPSELGPVLDAQGFLRCLPHVHNSDGFFAARMERA
ncbi:MAG: 16S rRNA (cytosine(967)-C(5))-methyltransferase RsmB [Proteobacteria bacterium]|nr:16S rRNA (cytosine(967)-C(5))-methyltransferase RsmB [Pseudomonadota bacterium]